MMQGEIKIRELKIVPSDDDAIELIYVPDQTQTLIAGREYRIRIEFEEVDA